MQATIAAARLATRSTAALAAVASVLLCACAAPPSTTLTTGPFRDLAGLDAALQRNVATKADIRSVFGVPNGGGAACFFSFGGDEREIWYYEDIEATGITASQGVMQMQMRQQILVVMFKGDRVDAYLWTSNKPALAPPK